MPERTPSQVESGYGSREIVAKRLSEIALVRVGLANFDDSLVTTTRGIVPMMATNLDEIRGDLKEVWGTAHPELFKGLGVAHYEDFADVATEAELRRGVHTRTWNRLGKFSGDPRFEIAKSLFPDYQTIDLDQLRTLFEEGALSTIPNFGPVNTSIVARVLSKGQVESGSTEASVSSADEDFMAPRIPANIREVGSRACELPRPKDETNESS